MEVSDGFIVGVYNYCDRWCERCRLTNRCRLFADRAEIEFEADHGPLTEPRGMPDGRRLQNECQSQRVDWGDDLEAQEGADGLPRDLELATGPSPYLVENTDAIREKVRRARRSDDARVKLAMEAIDHFTIFVPVKMIRSFSQVVREKQVGIQSDANGSGKAALLGLEEMKHAWAVLVDAGHFASQEAEPFLTEIARMTRNIERTLPSVRCFVRPGFDEPDEVARVEAEERAGSI